MKAIDRQTLRLVRRTLYEGGVTPQEIATLEGSHRSSVKRSLKAQGLTRGRPAQGRPGRCRVCRGTFVARNTAQHLCSLACADAEWHAAHPDGPAPGPEDPWSERMRKVRETLARLARLPRPRKTVGPQRTCALEQCENHFAPLREDQRFCSRSCAARANARVRKYPQEPIAEDCYRRRREGNSWRAVAHAAGAASPNSARMSAAYHARIHTLPWPPLTREGGKRKRISDQMQALRDTRRAAPPAGT